MAGLKIDGEAAELMRLLNTSWCCPRPHLSDVREFMKRKSTVTLLEDTIEQIAHDLESLPKDGFARDEQWEIIGSPKQMLIDDDSDFKEEVERARNRVIDYFGATMYDYDVWFNDTGPYLGQHYGHIEIYMNVHPQVRETILVHEYTHGLQKMRRMPYFMYVTMMEGHATGTEIVLAKDIGDIAYSYALRSKVHSLLRAYDFCLKETGSKRRIAFSQDDVAEQIFRENGIASDRELAEFYDIGYMLFTMLERTSKSIYVDMITESPDEDEMRAKRLSR